MSRNLWRQQRIYALSWLRFDELIMELASDMRLGGFDAIVGIAKGGLIPAVRLAHLLDLPYAGTIAIKHNFNNEPFPTRSGAILSSVELQAIQQARILLVDDIVGSGQTLTLAVETLRAKGFNNLKSMSLAVNVQSTVRPEFFAIEVDDWLVFPWEMQPPGIGIAASEIPTVDV